MHVIVSDLHLGKGDKLDDFLLGFAGNTATIPRCLAQMDEKFGDFLKFLADLSSAANPVKLILLGDIFDLIQVTGCDGGVKLDAIREAHPAWFRYLQSFAAKHEVHYIVGNHDAEMLNPEMGGVLKTFLPDLRLDPHNLPKLYYEEGSLYCEHGNQLEGPPGYNIVGEIFRDFVKQPFTDADYPAGSRFVTKFVNELEAKYPDVDNTLGDRRAATTYYIVNTKRREVFENFLEHLHKVWSGIRTASLHSEDEVLLLYSLLTGRPPESPGAAEDKVAAELNDQLREYVGSRRGVQAAAARSAASGAYELLKQNGAWLADQKGRLAADVDRNATCFVHNPGKPAGLLKQPDRNVRFIVCGHTHKATVVTSNDGSRQYINSGTWRHFYRSDDEEPIQNLNYVSIDGPKAELRVFK